MAGPDPLIGLVAAPPPPVGLGMAAGDFVLALIAGLVLAFLVIMPIRALFAPRPQWRRNARKRLVLSRQAPPQERLFLQARLLHQIAQHHAQPDTPAQPWHRTLASMMEQNFFTTGAGAQLLAGLYQPGPRADPEEIDRAIDMLLRKLKS